MYVLVGKLFWQIVGCYQTSAEIIVIVWAVLVLRIIQFHIRLSGSNKNVADIHVFQS